MKTKKNIPLKIVKIIGIGLAVFNCPIYSSHGGI